MKSNNLGPFPTFFRASLYESRTRSYAHAGYTLSLHVRGLLEENDRDGELDKALEEEDAALAVWRLIESDLPRCAAAVPRRRREMFVQGIQQAIDGDRL
jgi:hypothetical protein